MATKKHLDKTWNLWFSCWEEMQKMKELLSSDKINDQFYRRLLLRNMFSIIETYLFVARELVKIKFSIDGINSQEVWQQISLLSNEKVTLDSKGNIQTKEEFYSFEPSLRFTLNIFSSVFASGAPDYSDNNFAKLISLNKRRNDITHPKDVEKLTVTDQEVKDSVAMFGWFINTHENIGKGVSDWLREHYNKLK